jgi:hypothetical protein
VKNNQYGETEASLLKNIDVAKTVALGEQPKIWAYYLLIECNLYLKE